MGGAEVIFVSICLHTCMCVCIRVCVCVCVCIHTHTHSQACRLMANDMHLLRTTLIPTYVLHV